MAAVSHREKTTLVLLVFTVLFGILGLAFKPRFEIIRQKNERLGAVRQELRVKQALVNSSPLWNARFEKLGGSLPVFPLAFDSTTYWNSRMDAAAAKVGDFKITKRLNGEEKEVGDAFEFTLEVKEYEGTLDSIAKFLYELESDGSKFDIRDLAIRPHRSQPGKLQGSFTLSCAYMKVDAPAPAKPAPQTPAANPTKTPAAEPPAPAAAGDGAPDTALEPRAAEPEKKTEPETNPKPEAKPTPETKPETKPAPEPKPAMETKPAPKPEDGPDPKWLD